MRGAARTVDVSVSRQTSRSRRSGPTGSEGVRRSGPAAGGARWHLGGGFVLLGFVGSALMAIAAPRLVGGDAGWWYSLRVPPGRAGDMIIFYVGLLALSGAWLGLGRRLARYPGARPRELAAVALLWSVPLAVAPPMFSGDMYSYLAQGTILHLGLDPYRDAPAVLAHLGRSRVLDAVSPFWRGTTAPYGPLFLGLVSGIVALTGSNLVAGVVAVRLLEVVGVALLAVFVPRLARSFGADPCRATWLAVMSPLVLAQLVAAGHNDALMAGLMVAGLTLARDRRWFAGIALCALAATVKIPALAAIVFLLAAAARPRQEWRTRARLAGGAAAVTLAVLALVSVGTGTGARWLSTAVLATPAKVHLSITPVTALAWTASRLLRAVGASVGYIALDRGLGVAALLGTLAVAAVCLSRTRESNLPLELGVALVAAAFLGPAAWPWYFSWGIAVLAAWPGAQRSRSLPVALAGSTFLVKPDGILALPLELAPVTLALYAIAAAIAFSTWRRSARGVGGSRTTGRAGTVPARY